MPRVSVIIPIYNSAAFLDRCIISVLRQSFSDFELIMVDDCSKDHSTSYVRNFGRNDARVKLAVHKENRGPGAARNTGLALARGEYVTFVDSDDFIEPHLFQNMVQGSKNGKYDIIETGCQAIDGQDRVLWNYEPTPMTIEQLGDDPKNIFLVREWGVTQKLWRRSLFNDELQFPVGVYWEDIAIVPSLIVDAKSLVRLDYIGYNYLQHSTSITNTRSIKHVQDMFAAFDYFIAHLHEQNLFDKYQSVLPYLVESRVEYFLKTMREIYNANPAGGDSLIRLTEQLLTNYLATGFQSQSIYETASAAPHWRANLVQPNGTGKKLGSLNA